MRATSFFPAWARIPQCAFRKVKVKVKVGTRLNRVRCVLGRKDALSAVAVEGVHPNQNQNLGSELSAGVLGTFTLVPLCFSNPQP